MGSIDVNSAGVDLTRPAPWDVQEAAYASIAEARAAKALRGRDVVRPPSRFEAEREAAGRAAREKSIADQIAAEQGQFTAAESAMAACEREHHALTTALAEAKQQVQVLLEKQRQLRESGTMDGLAELLHIRVQIRALGDRADEIEPLRAAANQRLADARQRFFWFSESNAAERRHARERQADAVANRVMAGLTPRSAQELNALLEPLK